MLPQEYLDNFDPKDHPSIEYFKGLWHSVASHIRSGYGTITRHICTRLFQLGYDIIVSAYYGIEPGGVVLINNVPHAPCARHLGPFGEGSYKQHYRAFKRNCGILASDFWAFPWFVGEGRYSVMYSPMDHINYAPHLADLVKQFDRVASFLPFQQEELMRYGIQSTVIPHGVDRIFQPIETLEARKIARLPEEGFMVGIVSANSDKEMRKSWGEIFMAAEYIKKNYPDIKDIRYFCHTDPEDPKGVSLKSLAYKHGVLELFGFEDPHIATIGITDNEMVLIYNSFDILLCPSKREGFGLPILEAMACVPESTKVNTVDEAKNISEIKVGDLVTGKEGFVYPVMKVHKRLINEDIYRLNLTSGEELYITGGHSILTNYGWKLPRQIYSSNKDRLGLYSRDIGWGGMVWDKDPKTISPEVGKRDSDCPNNKRKSIKGQNIYSKLVETTFQGENCSKVRFQSAGVGSKGERFSKGISGMLAPIFKIETRSSKSTIGTFKPSSKSSWTARLAESARNLQTGDNDKLKKQTQAIKKEFNQNREIQISDITKIHYNGIVYNLGVLNSNSYYANGILVHNCGKPVIAHRFSSMPDLIGHKEERGWLCKTAILEDTPIMATTAIPDWKDIARCILDAYNHPRKLKRKGKKAREFSQTLLWDDIVTRDWVGLFDAIAEEQTSRQMPEIARVVI